MNERQIKELLEVLLKNINKLQTGLCGICILLKKENIISTKEKKILLKYIKSNRPKINYLDLDFMWCEFYYWRIGRKIPRLNWLKKHIKKHEQE